MQKLDPAFARIARRLSVLELAQPTPRADDGADHDDGPLFVDTYSEEGVRRVIVEYGLDARLRAQGLHPYRIEIARDDPFRHRLRLVLHTHPHTPTALDLRLHLTAVRLPGDGPLVDVVIIDWLLMQNPLRTFTEKRPPLPGQTSPGTGLGRFIHQLMVILAQRTGRCALINVPEHHHTAELYRRIGWVAVHEDDDDDVTAVMKAGASLPFALRAWAVERGCFLDEHDQPYVHRARERIFPVTEQVADTLRPGGLLRLARAIRGPRRRFRLDGEKLHRSLEANPVLGLRFP